MTGHGHSSYPLHRMKWYAKSASDSSLSYAIETEHLYEPPSYKLAMICYMVWVYKNGKNTHDYMQDNFDQAKSFALDKFAVPLNAWRKSRQPEWMHRLQKLNRFTAKRYWRRLTYLLSK